MASSWSFFTAVLLLCASGFNCEVTRASDGTLNINSSFTDVNVVSDLETTFDGKGLEPWYDVAKSFIYSVQSDNIPLGDFKEDFKMEKFLKGWEMPFIIVFAIGVLFAIIIPFVGLWFCCCRCCGNCGGEMVQKENDHNSKKRIIFSIILSIITLLMFVGCLMAFVSNDRITDTAQSYRDTPLNVIKDLNSYFNQTLRVVNDGIIGDVLEVLRFILIDVVKFPDDISKSVKVALQKSVEDPLDGVVRLATQTKKMEMLLKNVTEKTERLKTNAIQLEDDIKVVSDNLSRVCNANAASLCSGVNYNDSLKTDANFASLPDVSGQLQNITEVVNNSKLEENARKGLQQFKDIDQVIKDETNETVKDIRGVIDDATKTFTDEIKDEVTRQINKEVLDRTSEWTDKVNEIYDDYIEPYDKYRYYVAVGIACLILLPVLLMAIGLLCGICGHKSDRGPTDRGGISHTGGNMLMAAVGFMFIFVFFLMLFTSICFIVGANFEAGCRSVRDESIYSDFIDDPKYWDGKYILSDVIFNNGSKRLTIESVIVSCRKDQSFFQAINGNLKWNLTEKFNVRKELGDFEDELNNFTVNIDDQKILNNETVNGLLDLGDSGVDDINFTKFFDETNKSVVANLSGLVKALETKNNSNLETIINGLKMMEDDVEKMQNLAQSLRKDVTELKTLGGDISNITTNVLAASKAAETEFKKYANEEVKKEVQKFSSQTLGYIDKITSNSHDIIENKLAKCKVLANIYDATVNLLCRDTVFPFNGYWFSIGFSLIFYIPAIIFCVKLAKHYRRMDFEEGFDRQNGHEMTQFERNAVYPK